MTVIVNYPEDTDALETKMMDMLAEFTIKNHSEEEVRALINHLQNTIKAEESH